MQKILRHTCWIGVLAAAGACSNIPTRSPDNAASAEPTANDTQKTAPDTALQRDVQPDVAHPALTPAPAAAETQPTFGDEVALRAIALVGKPYRYGGADLHGFDCSGLVFYIYHQLGIELPRSAAEQQRYATKISRDDLQPGDLLFFRINRRRISHVGIYVGDNRFVHAPQTGRNVVLRNLDEEFFTKHWVSAGRIDEVGQ